MIVGVDGQIPDVSETLASIGGTSDVGCQIIPQSSVQVTSGVPILLWRSNLGRRRFLGRIFATMTFACTVAGTLALVYLLWHVGGKGSSHLTWEFLQNYPSRFAHKAGIRAALYGSIWLTVLTAFFAIPVGVAAAIYLEEFAEESRIKRFIDLNIANLAGVPSIVYGMFGLAVFVRVLALGRSVMAGALTMAILILPIIIVAAREALKSIPNGIRQAAYALGSTKWQAIWHHVLPAATPGILTGVILAMARAAGETAPLILIGALSFVAFVPEGPLDSFTVLPIQIFNWVSRPQEEFHSVAAAGILVLLALLLTTNALAIFIRYRFQRKAQW
jgi:phosphate transport system permease protein